MFSFFTVKRGNMNKRLMILAVIITIIYGLITLNTVLHHEVWADEAQVWQLCTHLSIPELFQHLKNEGHPALFYLIVMPFAKIFSDIIYMKIICWLSMCLATFLLVYYSPFKIYTKLAIILSAGFLYFFPVIARNYSIIPFLVFLAALLYNKSKQYPIIYAIVIALIANTHIIMFAFSAFLGVLFFYDNILLNIRNKNTQNISRYIISCFIILFGLLCVFYELSGTTGNNVFIKIDISHLISSSIRIITLFFINSYNYDIGINTRLYNPFIDLISIFLIAITFIACFINIFVNSKKMFFTALIGISFQLGIYIIAYNSFVYVNRVFCAYLIIIFCYWIILSNNNFNEQKKFFKEKSINILLTILFALTIYNGINYTKQDIKLNYSGAKETAEFIKQNINPDNSVIFIDNEPYMISLAYYLRGSHKLYSAFRKKYLDYVIWDNTTISNYADLGWSNYISYLKETDNRDFYIVNVSSDYRHKLEQTQTDYFEMIFKSGITVETYEGYRVFKYIGTP